MSVKVAVRVRPFNSREKELNCKLCVEMVGNTTILTNPEDGKTKDFAFDYSFWSHDEYAEDENGYFSPATSKYADQNLVFNTVGKEVLDNAMQGYHCCLFAYGQTGAGKSYSMVGYGANKGIVPIALKEIFVRIEENKDPNKSFEVSFSMLEIYNERIQDLLINVKERPHEGLKVREHQKLGVYVEGAKKFPVSSYEAIEERMEEGNKNRTIGATLMNANSSRAHTIIQIEFKSLEIIEKKKTERLSIINLVDLAGSEKVAKTGAAGDRMKEACAINQSLSTLGLVISKLADKSMGKKNVVVPYRDSVLTRILQNALGGNSKTLMICAISPATDNYEETLSTLRYADQAKKIKCNAVINESEQDKMIRELREENDKLRLLLKDFKPGEGVDPSKKLIDEETLRKYLEMEEQLKSNALLMKDYETSFQERLAEAERDRMKAHENSIDKTKPFLLNLNEDPVLTGKVLHPLVKDKVLVGKKNGNPLPDIILGSLGIKPNHAEFFYDENKILLQGSDEECCESIFVNGAKLTEPRELFHNDRIIFGANTTYLFKYPERASESPNHEIKEEDLDYEFAQAELHETINKENKIKIEDNAKEIEEKIKTIEEKFIKEKAEKDEFFNKQQEEYERKLKEIDQLKESLKKESESKALEIQRMELQRNWELQYNQHEAEAIQNRKERERQQKAVKDEARWKTYKENEKIRLDSKLRKYISQISEINLIAKEMKRNIVFSIKLTYKYTNLNDITEMGEKLYNTKIHILVQNNEINTKHIWDMNKFNSRYFIIKDVLDKFYENKTVPRNNNEDPFWDPPEPSLLGQGYVCLECLPYLLDNVSEITIVGDDGILGKLKVSIIPCDEKGELLGEDTDLIEDPTEMINRRLDFKISIGNLTFNDNKYHKTHCEYSIREENDQFKTYQTSEVEEAVGSPDYNYVVQHTYHKIDDKTLDYLQNNNLNISVYGFDIPKQNEAPMTNVSPVKSDTKSSPDRPSFKRGGLKISTDDSSTGSASTNNSATNNFFRNDKLVDNGPKEGVIGKGAVKNVNRGAMTPQNQPVSFQNSDMFKTQTAVNANGKKVGKSKDDNCNIF